MAVFELDLYADEAIACALTDEQIEQAIELVLDEEQLERPCGVSLSIVGDARMQELNFEWRGIDKCTDVLSLECERPDDPDLAPGEPCELGDIVLAPAFIEAQSGRYATTFADEFRLLLIHGLLHLLGYDHLEDDEAEVMEAREDELVRKAHTDAPISHVVLTRHREDED